MNKIINALAKKCKNLADTLLTFTMRVFLLFIYIGLSSVYANHSYTQTKININVKDVSFEKLFKIIQGKSDYVFFYNDKVLDKNQKVSIKLENAQLETILEKAFLKTNLSFKISDRQVIVKSLETPATKIPQQIIKGTVTDDQGLPLPGVNVIIKGTNLGVSTDIDGKYQIKIPYTDEAPSLVFSFIGYKKQEILIGNKTTINLAMQLDTANIDEVVVIGYGTSKARDLTGVVSRLNEQQIGQSSMNSTVESLLQGRAVGVNVQIQSASPSSPISVIIRGQSSLTGNNQPLWVIDGVPQYSDITSGNVTNTLYNLNINDVKSIDILKDASATAVYGSRAANGVVIVTTKRGIKQAKPTIEYTSRLGLQTPDFNNYDYFNAAQYIDFYTKALKNSVVDTEGFDASIINYVNRQAFLELRTSEYDSNDLKLYDNVFSNGDTDWFNELTTNPLAQQQTLSLRGGAENFTYYTSLNYQNNEGVIKRGNSKLYGGLINLDANLSNKLRFGLSLNISTRLVNNKDDLIDTARKYAPHIPPFNEDGTIFTPNTFTENPYTILKNINLGKGLNFTGTGFFELDLLKGLTLRTAYTRNFFSSENLQYQRKGTRLNFERKPTRTLSITKTNVNILESTLSYAKKINDKHDINAVIGASLEDQEKNSFGVVAQDFPDDDVLINFNSAARVNSVSEDKTKNALVSSFARLIYNFDGRYLFNATVRRDGSSKFGSDRRWGIFPSAGIGWNVAEETFIKNTNVSNYISYFKLRASIGKAGSQNLGDFDWITSIGSIRYNESPAIVPESIGNPNLRWEESQLTDYGLDFGLFNERLRGSAGFYSRKNNGLLFRRPLPPSSSFFQTAANVASTTARGVELDLSWDIIRKNNSSLTFNFNIAKSKSVVDEINGIEQELYFPDAARPRMVLKPGDEIGEWYGYQSAGRLTVTHEEVIALQGLLNNGKIRNYRTDSESIGDILIVDQNKDGIINDEDRIKLGTSVPKAFGGFGFTFQHKGFQVSTIFSYAYGHKRLWNTPSTTVINETANQSNKIAGQSVNVLGPYEARFPRLTPTNLGRNYSVIFSDWYLFDASYIRLNAFNVSYRLPDKAFKDMFIKGINLSFQATNLLTITKYPGFDPQGNFTRTSIGDGLAVDNSFYPAAQNYNLGITIKLQ